PQGASIGRTVGLALANPSPSAQAKVTLQLIDPNGQPKAMHTLAIPPMGQISLDLSSLPSFQSILPATDFVGSVAISSNQPVAAITLGDAMGPFFSTPAFGPGAAALLANAAS